MFSQLSNDLTAEVLSFVEWHDEPSEVEGPPRSAYERDHKQKESRKRVGPYMWGRGRAWYPSRLQDLLRVFTTCEAARALFERDPRYKALCLCVAPHREHTTVVLVKERTRFCSPGARESVWS